MTKLFKLIKINACNYLNFYKILNAKTFKDKIKEVFKLIFIILIYGIFGFYFYMFANIAMDTFKPLGIERVLLGEFFALASIVTLITSISLADNILYNNKDYDLLNSLPIKKSTIILSKMLNLYISNFLFIIVIMLPVLFVYASNVAIHFSFYLLYILSMFIIPLIPTIVAIIIGSLITFISSRFKAKKFWQFLLMVASLGLYFFISFKTNGLEDIELVNLSQSFLNIFNKIYPLTTIYLKILTDYDLKALGIFLGLSLGLYLLTIGFISLFYKNIVSKLGEKRKRKNYHLSITKKQIPFISLSKKEIKRLFSSPVYVFNSLIGVFLLLGGSIFLLLLSPTKINQIIAIAEVNNLIKTKGPLLIGLTLLFSCTSNSSISLEGKNFWLLKSLPVPEKTIFFSKIMVNFGLLFIPSIISSLIFKIILNFSLVDLLIWILTCGLYAFFISLLGLIINLHFPLLNWSNEVRVVKQSLAVFLTMICGLALGVIFLIIKLPILGIDLIILILIISLYLYLNTIGKKLFNNLF